LGKVRNEHIELIRETIAHWTAHAQEWKEFDELKKTESELRRVHQNLNDEIAVISLRHVLPGRCKYCPL
jgi:aminoglycoside phosphotransferase family enzyme